MQYNKFQKSCHTDADLIPKRKFLHRIFELVIPLLADRFDIVNRSPFYLLGCVVLWLQLTGEWDLGLNLGAVDVGGGRYSLLGAVDVDVGCYFGLDRLVAALHVGLSLECVTHYFEILSSSLRKVTIKLLGRKGKDQSVKIYEKSLSWGIERVVQCPITIFGSSHTVTAFYNAPVDSILKGIR